MRDAEALVRKMVHPIVEESARSSLRSDPISRR